MSKKQNGEVSEMEILNKNEIELENKRNGDTTNSSFNTKFPYDNDVRERRFLGLIESRVNYTKMKDRKIVSNRVDNVLPNNSIQTNKYNWANFVPKNLMEQFSKKANLYFLFIGIMQAIPYISISEGIPVIFLPLVVIIAISGFKDFYEDYKRKRSDNEENSRKVLVFEKDKFVPKEWKDLLVGNIIKIEENQFVPADIVVLTTSESKGACYIETKNLDGETNLKNKLAPKELNKIFFNERFNEEQVIFEYERPSPYLYTFTGKVIDPKSNKISIDISNFLLRGCSLKNTKHIIGLVSYTGHDTKIMLNSFKARRKKSKVEDIMGRQIIIIFIVQSILCLFCSLYYLIWYKKNEDDLPYLKIDKKAVEDHNNAYNFFVRYGNWTLIFTNFVPISLLVTLEMVQFIQALFISYDKDMKLSIPNSSPSVQSSNLNEQLGQIQHIFSDKTGTLTCNIMDFKKISIAGQVYGETTDGSHWNFQKYPAVENVDFKDNILTDILENDHHHEHQNVKKALFFLAICHTVLTQKKDGDICYTASSPDEKALVNFAKFCGVEYRGTDEDNNVLVRFRERIYKYNLLYNFEFNSKRKRHSVLVRDENNKIILFSKGADSTLFPRLNEAKSRIIDRSWSTWSHLEEFGRVGLRTLVLTEKEVDDHYYNNWSKKYQEAITSMQEREQKMEELQEEMETDLCLIGATAIEDKLQDEVGQTIQALKEAGIKVWVLTGDKIETAINIGFSCSLLNNNLSRYVVEEKDQNHLEKHLEEILKNISEKSKSNDDSFKNALIISGDSLMHMVLPFIAEKILEIAEKCQAVLCCRVSPKQKQEIVSFIRKKNPNISTLAIGDGANDVNMITAAHVGVGIRGVEGQQAARASDYAIAEFRFLRKLLFYHGRECYRRNSILVCYNFFKNICLVLPQFWFGFYNNFAGQTLYDSFIYQLFNIFYASLPIIVFSIFDKEFPAHILVQNKINYYEDGLKNKLFNTKVFWMWFFFGTWQAVIMCIFSFTSLEYNFINRDGYNQSFWVSGTMVFGMTVVISNLKILIVSNNHTLLSLLVIAISLLLYLISLLILSEIQVSEFYLLFSRMFGTPNFHLGNLLILATTAIVDYGITLATTFSDRASLAERADRMKSGRILNGSFNPTKTHIKGPIVTNEKNHESVTAIQQQQLEREETNIKNDLISRASELRPGTSNQGMTVSMNPNMNLQTTNNTNLLNPTPTRINFTVEKSNASHSGFAFSQDDPIENKNIAERFVN